MGLRGQLMSLAKEHKRDPSGQYFRTLQKLLDLHGSAGQVTKEEVFEYVSDWAYPKKK